MLGCATFFLGEVILEDVNYGGKYVPEPNWL